MNVGKKIIMIEIKNLKLQGYFAQYRLNIPQLQINSKGITAVVGHNGAGKSSLLKVIAGLEKPYTGEVLYHNKNTFQYFEEIKEKIHLLSWNISLYQNLSGLDHLNLIKGLSPSWDKKLEDELLKDFSLPLKERIELLSRGEKSKLKLLLSLPRLPSVVLIDEVTNELDTESRRAIYKKLDFYSYETNAQIIVATNMIDDIERYATSIVLLRNGKSVLEGNLDAIKEERKSSFENIVRTFESQI